MEDGEQQTSLGVVAVARASLLPDPEGSGPSVLSGGFPGWGTGRGALALEILGVLEVSSTGPFGPGLPSPRAAVAAHHAAGPGVSTRGRAGMVVAAPTAADDG